MDWKQLIADLKSAGMKQVEIAEAIGSSDSALSELASGEVVDPRWTRGDALIALHKNKCRKQKHRD